jgi:hypothetical protein
MGRALPVTCCNGGAVVACTVGFPRFALARRAILAHKGAIDLRSVRPRRRDVLGRRERLSKLVQRNDRRCASSRRVVDSSPSVRDGPAAATAAAATSGEADSACSEKPSLKEQTFQAFVSIDGGEVCLYSEAIGVTTCGRQRFAEPAQRLRPAKKPRRHTPRHQQLSRWWIRWPA